MALEDNDLVVTTGGLGPTADDLTAEVAASVAGLPLLKDKAVTEELRRRYPDRTRYDFSVYPKVPSGAVVFKNETGTAPGSFVFLKAYDNRKAILMLPGPPDEMEPMFLVSVRPFLETFSRYRFRHRYVRLFGIGESKAEERIRDLVESQKEVTIAPYASIKEVVIRVSQRMDKAGGEDLTKAMTESLAGRFGPDVFEVGSRPLEAVLLDLLAERQMTMALAESCTAGMAASTLAGIPGSSAVLLGGVVTYNNEMKNRLLGVSSKILTSAGAVSCPVAIAMAEGCRARTGADVALSFTGIAGPGGGTEESPAGRFGLPAPGRGINRGKEIPFRRRPQPCPHTGGVHRSGSRSEAVARPMRRRREEHSWLLTDPRKTGMRVLSTGRATAVLMFSLATAKLTGFAREILIAPTFGYGVNTDAYFIGFQIPDLFYQLLIGGTFAAAVTPAMSASPGP